MAIYFINVHMTYNFCRSVFISKTEGEVAAKGSPGAEVAGLRAGWGGKDLSLAGASATLLTLFIREFHHN